MSRRRYLFKQRPHTFEEVMRKRLLAALLLVSFASALMAADDIRIEVLPVNGDANAVLDVLRPLVPKPGSINAYDGRLVIKSTEHNIEQVRAVLAKLDHRAQNLLISVRNVSARDRTISGVSASGTITTGNLRLDLGAPGQRSNRSGINGRVVSTRSGTDRRDVQTIRVLEGRPAFISAGEEVPVATQTTTVSPGRIATHNSIQYRQATSGFYVRARTRDSVVTLDVATQDRRRLNSGAGMFSKTDSYTTLSGRVGHWIGLGGVSHERSNRRSATLLSTHSAQRNDQQIQIKVELVR
ncbi:MAG: hypothetical protein ACI8PT_002502 [Gammaproteobacteria bacterium]|jgi:hypothetical protein